MAPFGFVASSASAWRGAQIPSAKRCQRKPTWIITPRMGMSVKTSPLPNSQIGLEISVGSEECSAAYNSILKELTKRSNLPGFRKGSAPKQLVINQYGRENVMASACEEVIEKSINKALKDGNIRAVGQAIVDEEGGVETIIANYSPKEPLSFKVKIDVWPEATFTGEYENLDVEAEESAFDESLVDKALQDFREKEAFSMLAAEGTKAKLGQLVVADMVGFYRNDDNTKGAKLPDIADGSNVEIKMAEGKFMPGFVEGLIGAEVGETKDVNVDFPAQNPRRELAGARAIFEVTVQAIKDIVLPELTDEFVQQVSEEKTLDDLRKQIKGRLDTEMESKQEKNINKAIDDILASITEVTLPESLVESQVKNKFANMIAGFKDKGMTDDQVKAMITKENYELYKERARPNVEKTLRVNFAVQKIANEQGIKIDPEEVEGQMALVRAELKGEEMEEDRIRDQIEAQLEHDLVLNYIKKTAKITIVPAKKEE